MGARKVWRDGAYWWEDDEQRKSLPAPQDVWSIEGADLVEESGGNIVYHTVNHSATRGK